MEAVAGPGVKAMLCEGAASRSFDFAGKNAAK